MLLRLIRETPPGLDEWKRDSTRWGRESEHEHSDMILVLQSVSVDNKLVETDERSICLLHVTILCAVRAGFDRYKDRITRRKKAKNFQEVFVIQDNICKQN